ncbi:MAG: ATP-binding protein [Nitrospirota bacterium]|nr:ATP-binding protein [Nitrospirota bacterium]
MLGASLTHAGGLLRGKVAELSMLRELGECAVHLESQEALAAAICAVVQNTLQVEACAMFVLDGEAWRYLSGFTDERAGADPAACLPGLIEQVAGDGGEYGVACAEKGMEQMAMPLRRGRNVSGALVLTTEDAPALLEQYRTLLTIVTNQAAVLMGAAEMYAGLLDRKTDLESELQSRHRDLEAARETIHQQEKYSALGQLVTGVSHELNSRLGPMLGYAKVLKEAKLPPVLERAVQSIEEAARESRQVVSDLMAFSVPKTPQPCVTRLVDLANAAVQAIHKETGNPMRIEVIEHGPKSVADVDPEQVGQALQALLHNAIQAVHGRPRAEVRLSLSTTERQAVVAVEDNGIGMPDQVRERIFEPFFTTRKEGQGAGLGLSMAQGLVGANGGDIHIETRHGHGTRVAISFPLVDDLPEEAPDTHNVLDELLSDKDKLGKVLVVETDSGDPAGAPLAGAYKVVTVNDEAAAMEALTGDEWDVVLLDLTLPRHGSIKLFEWARGHAAKAVPRIVFLVNGYEDASERHFLTMYRNPRVHRPAGHEELQAALEAVDAPRWRRRADPGPARG